MNPEQIQAIRDMILELRDEKEIINVQIDELIAQKDVLVERRVEINALIDELREGIES